MMKNYYISIVGALLLMALRIFAEANLLSVIFVVVGVTALLYGIRHATSKKEYIFITILFALTYVVRFYDYTDSHLLDIVLGIGIGLIMFIIMALERLFKKYDDHYFYVFIYPIVYLLFMYFSEVTKINLPFRLDTYFTCLPWLCQITSILGTYILDFLLAFTASTIVFIIDHKKSKETKTITIIYIVLMCFVFSYGFIHLNKMNKNESLKNDTVRIACVRGPNNYAYSTSTAYPTIDESLNILTETIEKAALQDSEILMFCEEAFGINDNHEETLIETTKTLAKQYNMHILLAYEIADTDDSNSGKSENKLCFVSSEGEVLYEYTKHCIIPFIETGDYIKGDKTVESFDIEVHGKTIKVASVICYDADYDAFMSNIDKDTELLLVPTWDWDVVKEEHFGVVRLRAISNKVTVIRSTYDGYSAVIDSTGSILEKDDTSNLICKDIIIYDVPIK